LKVHSNNVYINVDYEDVKLFKDMVISVLS